MERDVSFHSLLLRIIQGPQLRSQPPLPPRSAPSGSTQRAPSERDGLLLEPYSPTSLTWREMITSWALTTYLPGFPVKESHLPVPFTELPQRETLHLHLPLHLTSGLRYNGLCKRKGKAVPIQSWSGPEVSRKLRFPDFMTRTQGGGKFISLTQRPLLPPRSAPGTHFC